MDAPYITIGDTVVNVSKLLAWQVGPDSRTVLFIFKHQTVRACCADRTERDAQLELLNRFVRGGI